MYEDVKKHWISAYGGYMKNDSELLSCTSGGAATAISRHIIRNGGYVAGVTYSSDFMTPEYLITNKISDLEKFKGSKYVDFPKGNVYKQVKELLDQNEKVLFFGLPCTVGALHLFLKKDYENLLTVELICHGPTDLKVHQQYVEWLEKKYDSHISDFSVRKKFFNWLPPYLYAEFENGKVFKKDFYSTEYGFAFSVLGRNSCYNCQFRGCSSTGDIMIGDFWGLSQKNSFYNPKGVSAILVHTKKGDDILKSIEELFLFEAPVEDILSGNSNILSIRKKDQRCDEFKKLLNEKGLFHAVEEMKPSSEKIRGTIKNLIPIRLIPVIQKMLSVIRH